MIWNMRFHLKNFLLSIQIGGFTEFKRSERTIRFTARTKLKFIASTVRLLKQKIITAPEEKFECS